MKKIIFVIIVILILSGCSANASITIDENNNVKEDIYVYVPNSVIEMNQLTKDEFLDEELSYNTNSRLSSYNQERVYDENESGIKFTKNSIDICNSLKSSAFIDFFNEFNCKEEEDFYEINAKSNFICYETNDSEYESECNGLKSVNLSITLNQEVLSNNADSINQNTYIWNFNGIKDELMLKIKNDNKSKTTSVSNVTTKDSDTTTPSEQTNSFDKKIIILSFVLAGLIIVLIAIMLYQKHEKNKIEY